jgi:glycine dehydrogenase subunit 1
MRVPADAQNVIDALAKKGVLGGVPVSRLEPSRRDLRDLIVVASTEMNTEQDRVSYAQALREVL